MGDALLLGATLGVPAVGFGLEPTPFPVLNASGSPASLGKAHGRTFASEVKHNIGFYLEYLGSKTGREPEQLLSLARGFAPVLSTQAPALFEEIEGIAKGARRSVDEVLLVNARTDLLVLGRQRKPEKSSDPPEEAALETPGCTALALKETLQGRTRLAAASGFSTNPSATQPTCLLIDLTEPR